MIGKLLFSLLMSILLTACDGLPSADTVQTSNIITVYATEAPVYSDEVIPVQYTDDLSLLESTEYIDHNYAYRDGKVYYRQYHADSFMNDNGVWGYYPPSRDTDKEIISIDANGTKNELFSDKGYGNIYLIGERFYMTEQNATGSCVYSVDMQGQNRVDYGPGSVYAADVEKGILLLEWRDSDTWWEYYYILNCKTGEKKLLADAYYGDLIFCTYQDGWFYFDWHLYSNACSLTSISLDGEHREIISLTSENKDLGYPEHIFQVELSADRIFFCFGGYAGSGNIYQGGKFVTVKSDGSDYRAIDAFDDCYYLCEISGKPLLYFTENSYDTEVWDIEENIICHTDFPERIIHEQRQKQAPYDRVAIHAQNQRGAVYALPDASGTIIQIAPSMEAYIPTPVTEDTWFGHFYYADGFLYFIAEFNECIHPDWNAYHRVRTELYRLKLGKDTAELLYAY